MPPSSWEFFDNIAELAAQAKLDDAAKITWAIHYAGEESESWENVPCRTKGPNDTPATLDEFKEEVCQRYPHLLNNRRYSIVDLTKLLERTQDYHTMSQDDLGIYYQRFLSSSFGLLFTKVELVTTAIYAKVEVSQ